MVLFCKVKMFKEIQLKSIENIFDKEHRDLQKKKKYMRPIFLLIASARHPLPLSCDSVCRFCALL